MSKILVAYYSKTGNTKKAAEDIARALGADLEQIKDKKNRNGFFAYLASGRDAMKKIKTEIEYLERNIGEYDLVIFGSPVWGWNMTPAIRTFIEINKAKLQQYAFFVTSGNTDSKKIAGYFEEIIGRKPIAQIGFNAKEIRDKKIYNQKIAAFVENLSNAH